MRLLNLKLKNYRNCAEIQLNLNSSKILIIGKNAQGKTNILESIYFLANLKSPRTSNNLELIKFDENIFELNCNLEKSDTNIELDFAFSDDKKKSLRVNKVITKKTKEFKNILKTVLFSTQDLMLLRGTPQDRRDWLDVAIAQIYPAYDDRLSKYNKIRIQKNNLLKDSFNELLLDVYNEQLAICGSNIIYLRLKFLKEMEKLAQQKHSKISADENLIIKYDNNFIENEVEIEQILGKFKEKLEDKKQEEIKRCQAIVGPHRDDVIFYINEQESTKYASQGQQRTIVLSLKLAEIDIITEKTDEPPILLLDDVLAELDDLRQNYLLQSISTQIQTIITSVDTLLFAPQFLKEVKIYQIQNGTVIQ